MSHDDVVFRRRTHTPAIHVASHVDHEKRDARISVSMHACGSVHIVMLLCLAALRSAEEFRKSLKVLVYRTQDKVKQKQQKGTN